MLLISLAAAEGCEIHAGAVVFYEAPWNFYSMAPALAVFPTPRKELTPS